ncbi:UDP-glucose 4-epimerase GalE [Paenochrobactrum sp. BZR 588]|uniref:UDP-glucose 4-epimerase GalE n=1 Tax=unclassified Paenochrobactrum TaxID=2639760 RepID=UPI0038522B1B
MSILVTGGAGYIGSHTAVQLIESGHKVIIYDNFENSHHEAIRRIEKITGVSPTLVVGDIRDAVLIRKTLEEKNCEAVIHFAGLKAVGESTEKPILYYDYNVNGTLKLLEAMNKAKVKKLIFSSSATVYGTPKFLPFTEQHPLSAMSPYGRSKYMVEQILLDLFNSTHDWMISVLRYFNPVGAHESGLIGEDPKGIPNNLMPFIAQVASGKREYLNIWGNDYPTPDGTGVRDYIHVEDLASGHISALNQLNKPQCEFINLGTGAGTSVLEVIHAFERISNRKINYKIADRRPGDVAEYYADPAFANQLLGWKAEKDLEKICKDTWNWIVKNPQGY